MASFALSGRVGPSLDALHAYWCWWRSELLALLPPAVRRGLVRTPTVLLADPEVDGGGFRFTRLENGMPSAVGAADPAGSGLPIWLRLPPEAGLSREIEWPAMAGADLRRALLLDLDRQTPCPAEALWFGAEVLARDTARRRLTVAFAVAHAGTVEAACGRLRALHGVVPARVGIGTADGGMRFDLRPAAGMAEPEGRASLLPRSLRGMLLLLCALLGLLNLGLYSHGEQARRDRLDLAVAEARQRAQRVERLRTQIVERRQMRDDLMTRRADIGLLALLEQLTRLLPDEAWLDSVEVRGGSVYVTGYAPAAATLVAQIETSPMFADAQFRSPVTPDRARGRERFDMSIRLERRP
jgi:general secretion pathway protein L